MRLALRSRTLGQTQFGSQGPCLILSSTRFRLVADSVLLDSLEILRLRCDLLCSRSNLLASLWWTCCAAVVKDSVHSDGVIAGDLRCHDVPMNKQNTCWEECEEWGLLVICLNTFVGARRLQFILFSSIS
jgi:hypothetical protein